MGAGPALSACGVTGRGPGRPASLGASPGPRAACLCSGGGPGPRGSADSRAGGPCPEVGDGGHLVSRWGPPRGCFNPRDPFLLGPTSGAEVAVLPALRPPPPRPFPQCPGGGALHMEPPPPAAHPARRAPRRGADAGGMRISFSSVRWAGGARGARVWRRGRGPAAPGRPRPAPARSAQGATARGPERTVAERGFHPQSQLN